MAPEDFFSMKNRNLEGLKNKKRAGKLIPAPGTWDGG